MTLLDIPRDPLDRYYTPDYVADRFVQWLRIPSGAKVIEPSVGGGAWVRAVRKHAPTSYITGFDIDPQARGLALVDEPHCRDWLDYGWDADIIVGNPPFGGEAVQHVRRSLARAPLVALLLRTTFVEPVAYSNVRDPEERAKMERATLMRETPPALEWTWPERIRFGGAAGGDSVLHSLFIWRRGHRGPWLREMCWPGESGWMPATNPWGSP
jgi:hypothetical protein